LATTSFLWHDYETWGADPRVDRAAQFAAQRTDLELNPVGPPLVIYASPADDFLPHPEACLVTGLSPQSVQQQGIPEADFFAEIDQAFSEPGTCGIGYNSIRFDDEFTRYGLYRNFLDPYAREWQNGNSRWDLIDLIRLARALRPDGINWPQHPDGTTSFRLEDLTAANDIAHSGAHDALADVNASIALARLLRTAQPRLYQYLFEHRDKAGIGRMLDPRRPQPLVHCSARYPARLGCIATIWPVAQHPTNRNAVIVFDLRQDPEQLLALPVGQIRERLFTRTAELGDGVERIALKAVHLNRAPVLVPLSTLDDAARERWDLDPARERLHLQRLQSAQGLSAKLAEVFSEEGFTPSADPDATLYGGFASERDRRLCAEVRSRTPDQLAGFVPRFDDAKYGELLFRYRARNWPASLAAEERQRWDQFRNQRIRSGEAGISLADYRRRLAQLAADTGLSRERRDLVDALIDWPGQIGIR